MSGLEVDVVVRRGAFAVTAALRAEPGEPLALVGPNGSGKSTLVSAIAGLSPPEGGRIALDGELLDDGNDHVAPERRPIGVVFQDLLLFPHLSALENVAFPLRARGVDADVARGRATATLERLGLSERARAKPRDLSGGEAQRVALARALVAQPRLLLLDEPLSALDVAARAEVREVLAAEVARFEGVRVLVTHDPVEASMLGDRLVILEDGHITQTGTPPEIRDLPRSRYAGDLVGVNAYRGSLVRGPEGEGLVATQDGSIVVPWPDAVEHGRAVTAVVRPADVTLSLEPPESSARNVFRGAVRSIASDGERARVRLATEPPLVAEVTAGSAERLGLHDGVIVWASFKAVEVEIVLT